MEHFYKQIGGYFTWPGWYAWAAGRLWAAACIRPQCDGAPRVVELGCAYGQSAAFLAVELNNGAPRGYDQPFAQIDLVDTGDPGPALTNLAPVKHIIGAYHQINSWEAAALYADASLDMVFVDASHAYECVLQDIAAWRKKVRPGGILAGHDFAGYPDLGDGVVRAVTESFQRFNVDRGERFSDGRFYPVWWLCIGPDGSEAA